MSTLVEHPEYGFWQFKPTPSSEEITKFYKEQFYSSEYKNFNDSSLEVQVEDRDFHEGGFEDMASHLRNLLNIPASSMSLLDIGCGWSQALLFFSKIGVDCYGFDPAPEAVNFAVSKGLKVELAGMDRMDVFGEKRFDVVLLKNVLEHLADPVAILTDIRQKVLSKNGVLVIDVPNEFNKFQTVGRDTHGLSNWWVSTPAHLNYFSKDSLSSLLEGTGFNVKLAQASFPLEMFLLFGDCYVGDESLGKKCHKKRVAFEMNLRKHGGTAVLNQFYQALAELNLGRQITLYSTPR